MIAAKSDKYALACNPSSNTGEVEKIREIVNESNRRLSVQGMFSRGLYDELLRHLDEYRNAQKAPGSAQ